MKKKPIIGVGIDTVEIELIKKAHFKKRLAEYFLTSQEVADVPKGQKSIEHLASRFALKEAIIKAFPKKLSPFDFYIDSSGKSPNVIFFNKKNNKYSISVSITHTDRTATAIAIISTH